jgi:hypothetical protein
VKLRTVLANLSLSLGTVVVVALLAEIALRFAPVNQGFSFPDVDAANPVLHAAPDQDVVSSQYWDFYGARTLHVNNAGFRNDQDYADVHDLPLIAVVGDSYVEAVQVDYADAFFGRLARALEGRARVYSFGFAGAALSQYLVWAKHARERFGNALLVVNVVGNDFDESLAWYKQGPGFHHYAACGGTYCLMRVDLHRGRLGGLLKHSALARYLVYNLRIAALPAAIGAAWSRPAPASAGDAAYVGNVAAVVDDKRLAESKLAVDLFLADLPGYAGLAPGDVTFVLDGRDYGQDDAAFDATYFGQMRNYFIDRARSLGFAVIDMRPVFARRHGADGSVFQSPRDGHWNALGHELVAAELAKRFGAILP